ncbi:hypothetical protein PI172_0826 [Prevotella intermedia]|uniref:Uncharacterized protein n=1 Tax=Prevotella intermedia TaxID=28131 RepID=A0AAD1F6X6_PREIN|nr:hypothetical protein PI172_0826 [Prevotella intermedia]
MEEKTFCKCKFFRMRIKRTKRRWQEKVVVRGGRFNRGSCYTFVVE